MLYHVNNKSIGLNTVFVPVVQDNEYIIRQKCTKSDIHDIGPNEARKRKISFNTKKPCFSS